MNKFWENYIKTRPANSKGAFEAFRKMSQEPRTMAQGGRIGFSRAGLASYPPFRGRSGADNLKAWRGREMLEALTGTAIGARGAQILTPKDETKKDIVERIEKVESDRKEPDQEPPQYPYDPEEDLIKKTLEEILRDRIRAEEKKKKDKEIFSDRMHGEAGFKGRFTGSGTERKSIPPADYVPQDKTKLALFKNNKNLEGLETKTINSLMEFRKNPELFYERVKELKARGVDFDALYNPAEIAELLGLKTASGITDAIVSKNIPFEKIGAFKAVKLNDYINSQIATIEKFKDVAVKGKEDAQRGDVMDEFEKGSIYSRFKKLRQPQFLPDKVLEIYNKYNLSEIQGGHPNPLILFAKKWKDGKLTNEREFPWIYRNKDKLLTKNNLVFQSKDLNQKGGPFYDLIKDLKVQYKILSPLVDKYEGKGRVTNLKDKKLIEDANNAIMKIVYQSQLQVDDWINKTGKYKDRKDKPSDILSIARMREGGLHGNLFNTDTGEVSLYTAAGEGAGTVTGAVDEDEQNIKLKMVGDYIDILTNVIEDKKDKQILIEYFSDKVLPKFNRGGPVEVPTVPWPMQTFAGGGMAGIRKPSALPPTGGPMSQGLRSLYNNVRKW